MSTRIVPADAELEARGLPKMAFLDNTDRRHTDSSASVVAIRRGERGFYSIPTEYTADQLNSAAGVTDTQVKAMEMGSKKGWHCPESFPARGKQLEAVGTA